MPSLSGLQCNVELSPHNLSLPELDITYRNQGVSCTVGVPDDPTTFNIHFSARDIVGHGIAAFVFIDGQYQANRNWTGMSIASRPTAYPTLDVDFRFRQKEELASDGRSIIARDWHFSDVKTASGEESPFVDPTLLQNIGTIEVVVLRCASTGLCDSHGATDVGFDDADYSSPVVGGDDARSFSILRDIQRPTNPNHGHSQWFHAGRLENYGISGESEMQIYPVPKSDRHAPRSVPTVHVHPKYSGADTLQRQFASISNVYSSSKDYWAMWNAGGRGYGWTNNREHYVQRDGLKDPHIERAYEQPLICKNFAKSKDLTVQVTTGMGALYSCSKLSPDYLDCMQTPFAVFTFHYRRRQALSTKAAAEPVTRSKASKSALRAPSQRQGGSGIGALDEQGKVQSIANQDKQHATKEDQQPKWAASKSGGSNWWPKVEDLPQEPKNPTNAGLQDKSSHSEKRGVSKAGSRRSNSWQNDEARSKAQEGEKDKTTKASTAWGANKANSQGWDARSRKSEKSAAKEASKSQAGASNASKQGTVW